MGKTLFSEIVMQKTEKKRKDPNFFFLKHFWIKFSNEIKNFYDFFLSKIVDDLLEKISYIF